MGIFSRRPDTPDLIEKIEEGKRKGSELSREIYGRITDGTATDHDMRVWNAGRYRKPRS
ncbi:hypothetical protein GCM10010277_44140 [Streptomyces longisporoflavus]|uniref:hypothetical protein n=1 Tax=Streptomyces longisporoflavus TaxID=28044 RepID=UPI00167EBD6F|nr:hypothetical protein [Streptomyces longisporoflavus]GGV49828.1 hypothetical protein GCM10010277_44140 [Streptomyces longisporoflavus]